MGISPQSFQLLGPHSLCQDRLCFTSSSCCAHHYCFLPTWNSLLYSSHHSPNSARQQKSNTWGFLSYSEQGSLSALLVYKSHLSSGVCDSALSCLPLSHLTCVLHFFFTTFAFRKYHLFWVYGVKLSYSRVWPWASNLGITWGHVRIRILTRSKMILCMQIWVTVV